jgi:hypothetical protein
MYYAPRVPSLRELRRKCPANVVILPTAPTCKVKQKLGLGYQEAKRELLARQVRAFPDKSPAQREREATEREALSLELRADVPPFDPSNPRHLRAWESVYDLSQRSWERDKD